MVIWRNEEKSRIFLLEHFDILLREFEAYCNCFKVYFDKGCMIDSEVLERVEIVHKAESKCDDKRREFKEFLYSGGMLPEVREDLIKLIDANDRIANRIEYVTDFYTLQKIHIFHSLTDEIYKINELTYEGLKALRKVIEVFFIDHDKAKEFIKEVQHTEHEVDKLERKFIIEVFDINTSLSEKMLLREFINLVGDISDFAENATDIINIIMIKRAL